MIIDFHTHIFPEKIADATINHLSTKGNISPFSNGKADGLLTGMKRDGVDISVVLPVVTRPKQFDSITKFAEIINEGAFDEEGAKVISFGGIHPESEDYKHELNVLHEKGFKGIKLHPDYQETFIDDIKMLNIIDYASSLGMIIVTHAGFDVGYPELTHCTPDRVLNMLNAVKPDKMVLAHMGGVFMGEWVEKILVGREVYFDTSYVADIMVPEQFTRMIKNHGADKILFASDSPWKAPGMIKTVIENCEISSEEKEMILGGNAAKLLGI